MEQARPDNLEPATSSTDYQKLFAEANRYPAADRAYHVGDASHSDRQIKVDQAGIEPAVDLKIGKETLLGTRDSVELFRDQMVPQLGLSERLKTGMDAVLSEILESDIGILVDGESQARLMRFSLRDGVLGYDPEGQAAIEMGTEMIEVKVGWVEDAARRAGVELTQDQVRETGRNWLVWHELGHGLQQAYARTAPSPSPDSPYKIVADIREDAMSHGVSERFFGEGDIKTHDTTIESERFAEGFSQMLVERYATTALGLSADEASRLRAALTPPERYEKMARAEKIARDHLAGREGAASNVEFVELGKELRADGVTINSIGYGSPYPPEKIMAIIQLANRLADEPVHVTGEH